MKTTSPDICELPPRHGHPAARPFFSPLGWSVGKRLTVAVAACAVLWTAVLWALD